MSKLFSDLEIPFSLDICGDGPLFYSLHKNNITPAISFKGRVSPSPGFFSNYGLFVSFSQSEGLPNSVIEALYNGLVCILSPIPAHKYLQNFTDRIFILEDFEPVSLQAALHKAQTSTYSSLVHKQFCEYFHPSRMLDSYMDIYLQFR